VHKSGTMYRYELQRDGKFIPFTSVELLIYVRYDKKIIRAILYSSYSLNILGTRIFYPSHPLFTCYEYQSMVVQTIICIRVQRWFIINYSSCCV